MSGYLLDAVQVASSLLGYASVTLGPVTFTGLELPPGLPVGSRQSVAIQQQPGGSRVINAMGATVPDISWQGIIMMQGQTERVRLIDAICKSGQAVTLAWDVFSYQVLVTSFDAPASSTGPIQYKITCTVIADNTAPTGTTLGDLASEVIADVSSGDYLGALGAVSQGVVAGPVASATTAVGTAGATTVGSTLYNNAVTQVNAAATAIDGAEATVNTDLQGYGTSLTQLSAAATAAAPILDMTGAVGGVISSAADAANLAAMSGYMNRAAQNLKNASA